MGWIDDLRLLGGESPVVNDEGREGGCFFSVKNLMGKRESHGWEQGVFDPPEVPSPRL